MNVKSITKISCVLLVSLIISSCGTRKLLLQTPTPTPLLTTISPSALAPTPLIATFDDNLCGIKGSFVLDGELCYTNDQCIGGKAFRQKVEGSPSYALGLLGNSINGNSHYLTIWVKYSSSPGPNEMQTLPDQFSTGDIKIYASDDTVLQRDLEPVRLKLHAIPALITEEGSDTDPLLSCDYVVEEIKLR